MWKLTIERTYMRKGYELEYSQTDVIVLNFPSLGLASQYIHNTQEFADGELKYHLEYVEKEGEEEC